MHQLESQLATLTKRANQLTTKRAAGKDDLDRATAAREKHMLEGDLDDIKIGAKLQANVDAAVSALAGYDDAIKKQSALIADVEPPTHLGAWRLGRGRVRCRRLAVKICSIAA
jgi:hypothetical protein